jgi:ABC-type lipoprotein export system ATPase subunit
MFGSAAPVVEVKNLTREYLLGAERVLALRGVSLSVSAGEMVAIMGASGSGKSTLMNVLGCLDRPSAGEYLLGGVAVGPLDDDALADIRGERLGFVFQGFNLLPRTTAVENVALPMLYDRQGRFADPTARAIAALQRVGLGDASTTSQTSSPAASSSASPSPGPSSPSPGCSWPTSPRATSTPAPPSRSWRSFRRSTTTA